ncbi:MAG TPA: 2-phosphosulfolactate phosphatase [Steroidobacter sp.]|jgi:2-phosphosulfolactate phosphatase|nr:2-phosphosulfolactate phosphatase [Steroidobacteraceae bacterium]HLS82737.1 2-phosphosulfolactate phosphatase [Steroidobacter sp.]
MQVSIVDFLAGAREARGLTVVIDVFRAFSLAAYAFARGARAVIPVACIEDARELKRRDPTALLVGERHARPLPGFDCGNSPTELERLDVRDRTLIHTTHSGTQGLTAVGQAAEVLTGALVNAAAIVRYIRARAPQEVTLVRMGHEARERCAEDDLCAQIIAQRLGGQDPDVSDVAERLRSAPSARKFFDPACDWAPERDFELCTRVDVFDFVLCRDDAGRQPVLRCIPTPKS